MKNWLNLRRHMNDFEEWLKETGYVQLKTLVFYQKFMKWTLQLQMTINKRLK